MTTKISDQIKKLNNLGFKIIDSFNSSDNLIGVYELESFIDLAIDLQIKHIFVDSDVLMEEEIESAIVTQVNLLKKKIPLDFIKKLNKEIALHNKKVNSLRERIGEEKRLELFFSHNGTVYQHETINDKLCPDDQDEFIDGILDRFVDEIHEAKEKEFVDSQINDRRMLASLEQSIINHEDFKLCGNETGRKNLTFKIYEMKADFLVLNNLRVHELQDYISLMWAKHRDSLKKSSN